MLKNEEIRQKHPFFIKELNDFEAEWITCGCICRVRKKTKKTFVTLWILSTKNLFITA